MPVARNGRANTRTTAVSELQCPSPRSAVSALRRLQPSAVRKKRAFPDGWANGRSRTQSGPTTDTASRLALVQTPPGLPGLQADFGHRFRKAQPLAWIGANGVSTLRRCSNTATHEARFLDALSCQFGAASRVHSCSAARQGATASSRRAVPLSRAPRALCRDYSASTTGMRQSSIRESPMPSSTA
jgi:hypothetical protein